MKMTYLKTLNEMCDFIYNWWFIWWELEKTPEIYKNENKGKKFPIWLTSHPPVYKNGGRLFSSVQKHQKQAGPTLGETGILV